MAKFHCSYRKNGSAYNAGITASDIFEAERKCESTYKADPGSVSCHQSY